MPAPPPSWSCCWQPGSHGLNRARLRRDTGYACIEKPMSACLASPYRPPLVTMPSTMSPSSSKYFAALPTTCCQSAPALLVSKYDRAIWQRVRPQPVFPCSGPWPDLLGASDKMRFAYPARQDSRPPAQSRFPPGAMMALVCLICLLSQSPVPVDPPSLQSALEDAQLVGQHGQKFAFAASCLAQWLFRLYLTMISICADDIASVHAAIEYGG